jgi:hypothetical protein
VEPPAHPVLAGHRCDQHPVPREPSVRAPGFPGDILDCGIAIEGLMRKRERVAYGSRMAGDSRERGAGGWNGHWQCNRQRQQSRPGDRPGNFGARQKASHFSFSV